jgi:heat shock protein HslJ
MRIRDGVTAVVAIVALPLGASACGDDGSDGGQTADLLPGVWAITGVEVDDAVADPVAGTDPTLDFADSGDLSVTTGCNNGSGSWELDGDLLSIGPIASNQMACEEPAGVSDQEAAIFGALEAAHRVEVAAGELTILDEEDGVLLTAVAPSDGS